MSCSRLWILSLVLGLGATLLGGRAAASIYGGRFVPDTIYMFDRKGVGLDSLGRTFILIGDADTLHTSFLPNPDALHHSGRITDADFRKVAADLGVETAAMRAIVDIETGRTHRGINPSGKPVINFDLPVFRRAAARRGVNLAKHSKSVALQGVNIKRYGNQQAAQHARLQAAMAIDSVAAIESTFWGMFQIGGFNWKLCGTTDRRQFVEMMSRSEYDQLLLFANYIRNTGLLPYLKNKNWSAFARAYNGPSYAQRRYHTRMAEAYKKYKAASK